MAEVTINKAEEKMIRGGDTKGAFESMLTRFNRLVQASGVLKELKKYEHYEKPSVARARKKRIKMIKSRQQERKNAVHSRRRQRKARPLDRQRSVPHVQHQQKRGSN